MEDNNGGNNQAGGAAGHATSIDERNATSVDDGHGSSGGAGTQTADDSAISFSEEEDSGSIMADHPQESAAAATFQRQLLANFPFHENRIRLLGIQQQQFVRNLNRGGSN